MARIKITGYINTEDLEPGDLDLDHEMGLSTQGYEALVMGLTGEALSLSSLEDCEPVLEKD